MMAWERAVVPMLCGACPNVVSVGDPFLAFHIAGLSRPKVRCRACAGEPVPDLPAVIERAPTSKPMIPIQSIAHALPLDWKRQQTGEREPGCDDE
jgi:hypothetical protein